MALEYSIVIKGGNKAFEVFNNLNKINEMSEKINKVYDLMNNKTMPQFTEKVKKASSVTSELAKKTKGMNFGDLFTSIKNMDISGIMKTFKPLTKISGTFMKGFNRSMTQGGSLFQAFGRGVMGVFKGLTHGAFGLTAALSTIFLPILLIIAAIFALKKMWQTNFLGMQSSFNKFIGELKSMWGQFNAFFIKYLKAIEPMAKVVLTPFIFGLKLIWNTLKGLVGFFKAAFGPIFDAISEISAAFKGIGSDGKATQSVLDGMLWAFKAIGQVVGWIFKVVFTPIKYLWLGIAWIINKIVQAFSAFTNSTTWKILVKAFEIIKAGLDYVFGKKSTAQSPAAQANNNFSRTSTTDNRNQHITFNTGRATTPEESQQFANILAKQLN